MDQLWLLSLPLVFLAGGFSRRFAGGIVREWTSTAPWTPAGVPIRWFANPLPPWADDDRNPRETRGYRVRGAVALVVYGAIFAAVGLVFGGAWFWCLVLWANAPFGLRVHGLWDAGGMGHLPETGNKVWTFRRYIRDFLALSFGYGLAHICFLLPLTLWLAHPWWRPIGIIVEHGNRGSYHWLPLVLGAISAGVAYSIAWALIKIPRFPKLLGFTWDGVSLFPSALELAEWLSGGFFAIGIALTVWT